MSIFSMMSDFLSAGLTPDEKGEFKVGQSEMARLNTYHQQKIEDEQFFNKHNFNYDNWMNHE
jgi:hypothetical protein